MGFGFASWVGRGGGHISLERLVEEGKRGEEGRERETGGASILHLRGPKGEAPIEETGYPFGQPTRVR